MKVEDAIRRVDALCRSGRVVEERGRQGRRSGRVFVETGSIQRGLMPCPHCGAPAGMGTVRVRHDDGRSVSFNPRLFHYAAAGHPISARDVDGKKLAAIVADA
jgi:hypothetical protein